MRVQLITKEERCITGVSRYTQGLYRCLGATNINVQLTFPLHPPVPERVGLWNKGAEINIKAFFANYPLRAPRYKADVYHLSGQMLATLLCFQRFPGPVLVSVLDIIPYLVRHQKELSTFRHSADRLFYQLALHGLRRADAVVAISDYTRRSLIDTLAIPARRIHLVYPSIDLTTFRPLPVPAAFRQQYGLDEDSQYILFVGSEDPRKNIGVLVQALAGLKDRFPRARLLKVGASQFPHERQKLQALARALGVAHDVLFFDYVPEHDLPLFYNLADLFVMPSLYEGFGLPLVEAMACGTAVVYANAGSLPEIARGCGLDAEPDQVDTFVRRIAELLENRQRRALLGASGLERAAYFSEARAASELWQVYSELLENQAYATTIHN